MNLKSLTGPLTDKIGSLTALVQEMTDNIIEQTNIQKEILVKLQSIEDKIEDKGPVCNNPADM